MHQPLVVQHSKGRWKPKLKRQQPLHLVCQRVLAGVLRQGRLPRLPEVRQLLGRKRRRKTAGPTPAKSMAQIQKEEEARKKKIAAAAANAQATALGSVAIPTGGKSYANLAGKVNSPATVPSPPAGSAWTTVGAGGKPKTPSAPPPPPNTRATSSSVVPTVQPATAAKKPPTRSMTMSSQGTVNAQEEFRKWALGELRQELYKHIAGE